MSTIGVPFSRRQLALLLVLGILVLTAGCLSMGDTNDDTDIESTVPEEQTDADESGETDADGTSGTETGGEEATDSTAGEDSDDDRTGGGEDSDGTDVDSIVTGDSSDGTGDETDAGTDSITDGGTDGSTAETTDESLDTVHATGIGESETATTTVKASLETGVGDLEFVSTTYIDLSTEQARQRSVTKGSTAGGFITATFADIESYATPEATYERTTSDFTNETEYSSDPVENRSAVWDEDSLTEYLRTDLIGSADENVIWTRTGTDRFDGTETIRYEADSREQFDGFRKNATASIDNQSADQSTDGTDFLVDGESVTVTSMNATLLVSTDGVVRQLTYSVEGTADSDPYSLRIELSITDIDSTTVTAPDWLEDAERAGD